MAAPTAYSPHPGQTHGSWEGLTAVPADARARAAGMVIENACIRMRVLALSILQARLDLGQLMDKISKHFFIK